MAKRRPGPHVFKIDRLLDRKPVEFQPVCRCGWKGVVTRFYGNANTQGEKHVAG